jgi:protein TonB
MASMRFLDRAGLGNPLLGKALLVSVGLHLAFLAVRLAPGWTMPSHAMAPLLEVTLVNARSHEKPHAPQALAQVNLNGGGDHDDGRRRSPLPASAQVTDGDALEAATREVARLEAEQRRLLQAYQNRMESAREDPARDGRASPSTTAERQAMQRLQAEISREVSDYQKRPRVHHFMPSTSAYRFARYFENWRTHVEKIGNEHYPDAARGKIYGTVVMTVIIDRTGSLVRLVIERSSGSPVLDRAARRIVQLASPFPPFPPDLADTDQIELTRSMVFTKGQGNSPSQDGELRVDK